MDPSPPHLSQYYRFDFDRRIVVITWPPMVPEIWIVRSTVDAMLDDSDMKSGYSVLSDWRQSTNVPAPNYVHRFITYLETLKNRGVPRWATVVAADSDGSFKIGRLVEFYAECGGMKYRVFRDYDEALHWLAGGR